MYALQNRAIFLYAGGVGTPRCTARPRRQNRGNREDRLETRTASAGSQRADDREEVMA